jgi:hypothetical protein
VKSDRGEYRAIRTVLIDGPDYQELSPEARLTFLTLKLQLGPTGLGVINAAKHSLSDQTGYPAESVAKAMLELRAAGWLRWERNVFEIVGGLDHEPSIFPDNTNHRKSVASHLDGLPNLDIVRAFRTAHPVWFPSGIPSASDQDTMPIPSRLPNTDTEHGTLTLVEDAPMASLLITRMNQGMLDNPHVGEAMNPVPHGHAPSVAAAETIEQAGVPKDFAAAHVYECAKRYHPTQRNRQIKSLGYLVESTIGAWEKQKALSTANGTSRPAARTNDKATRSTNALSKWLAEAETTDAEIVING